MVYILKKRDLKRVSYRYVDSKLTNRGMLSKAWYEDPHDGSEYLVKGNTPGSVGSLGRVGYEPYSEVIAYQIAKFLGFPAVEYVLAEASAFKEVKAYKVKHVSVCKSFLERGFKTRSLRKTVNDLAEYNGVYVKNSKEALVFLKELKVDLIPLYRILLFDALIGNVDRHMDNIDMVVDRRTGEMSFAPIFDNGASLLAWSFHPEYRLSGNTFFMDRSRPFKSTHKEQIKLIPYGIFKFPPSVELLPSLIETCLKPYRGLIPKSRYEAIERYLSWRIRYLDYVTGGSYVY